MRGPNPARFAASGAIAGLVSAAAFTWLHDIVISDIRAMLPIMAVAGAACGAALGWSFALLFATPSIRSWLAYAGAYLVMFALLGVASVVVFEPVTTMQAVIDRGGPVDDLIGQAMPMTVAFTLVTATIITLVFGRGWRHFAPVLVTTAVLVLFLGLNVSAIGLVEIPVSGLFLVAELFGLVAFLGIVVIGVFAVLERDALLGASSAERGSGAGHEDRSAAT